MKVAIISDSHGSIDRLEKVFQNLSKAGIENILHAGDFLVEGVDQIFAGFPDLKFFIAIGNNDVNTENLEKVAKLRNVELAEVVTVSLNNKKISISHYDGIAESKSREKKEQIDIFIHGHTHRPQILKKGDSIMINPGALCEDGKYIVLDLLTGNGKRVFFVDSISI
jgi:putative phosphoesterase